MWFILGVVLLCGMGQAAAGADGNTLTHAERTERWKLLSKLTEYDIGSADWQRRVAASKFGAMPAFARTQRGHIALQDHGSRIEFRNIKLRELSANSRGARTKGRGP